MKKKYLIYYDAGDGVTNIPIHPDPVALALTGKVIAGWLKRFERQGYFRNARKEAVPLDEISFSITPSI